jgi:aerobic carbon-monoxide dehydrogenase medium subunit
MKPAAFDYHRPDTVEEAVQPLAELGEDAKILAGGQSMVRCCRCAWRSSTT